MDYSYILKTSKVLPEKLAEFGFEEKNGSYFCRKNILNGDFYSIIELKGNFLTAKVFESGSDERYVLFDVENANGSFVGEIRNQVRKIIELFRSQCCKTSDTKKKYVDFIQNKFGCKGDNPWSDTPENTVFRCKNKKWFALIIKIKFSRLGLSGDEEVFAVNLKANPQNNSRNHRQNHGFSGVAHEQKILDYSAFDRSGRLGKTMCTDRTKF